MLKTVDIIMIHLFSNLTILFSKLKKNSDSKIKLVICSAEETASLKLEIFSVYIVENNDFFFITNLF